MKKTLVMLSPFCLFASSSAAGAPMPTHRPLDGVNLPLIYIGCAALLLAAAGVEAQPPPEIAAFQLGGERWTRTPEGKSLGIIPFKSFQPLVLSLLADS